MPSLHQYQKRTTGIDRTAWNGWFLASFDVMKAVGPATTAA